MASSPSSSPLLVLQCFLRSVGLLILEQIPIVGFAPADPVERPKPIVQSSIDFALARSGVHLFPILTSITIISLNFCGLYLGRSLPGRVTDNDIAMALLQNLAKLQELLIVASLSTIIFHQIRRELNSRHGLPFGFLCSGFTFSQISYFWSPEFWGAFQAQMNARGKIRIAVLVTMAGIIAVTAGPSVAILLVPRRQDWLAGGSKFYLRGLKNDLYPSTMAGSPSDLPLQCYGPDSIDHAMCPSGGFHALSIYFSQLPLIRNGANLEPPPIAIFGQFSTLHVQMLSTISKIPQSQLYGSIRGIVCQTSAVAPYLPVLMYQAELIRDWEQVLGTLPRSTTAQTAAKSQYRYYYQMTVETDSEIPVVRTACSAWQTLALRETIIDFPVMPRHSCWDEVRAFSIPQLNNTSRSTLRATWVKLPSEFGAVSTGLVIEAPRSKNGMRVAAGCSIDARWAPGRVDGNKGHVVNPAPGNMWKTVAELYTPFRPPADGLWTPIDLNEGWLRLLTPDKETRDAAGILKNLTTLEILLENSAMMNTDDIHDQNQADLWNDIQPGSSNRTIYLEWMTSLLVADGLSRHRIDKTLDLTGPKSDWRFLDYQKLPNFNKLLLSGGPALHPPNSTVFTTFPMTITIQGLAYKVQSVADYLAISVLLAHIVLAIAHTAYTLYQRKSSSAWDSISEMVALAHNSHPSIVLENTSAGVRCFKTFGRVAKVRASGHSAMNVDTKTPIQDTPGSHVQLVFTDCGTSEEETTVRGNNSGMIEGTTLAGGFDQSEQESEERFVMVPCSSSGQSSVLPRQRRIRTESHESNCEASRRGIVEWPRGDWGKLVEDRLYS